MITMLVGLNVTDEAEYQRYRDGMTPLLHACGGSFRYDFKIGTELRSEASHPINRLFMLAFPDQATRDRFFSDPRYLEVRKKHFDGAVKGRTTLAVIEEASAQSR